MPRVGSLPLRVNWSSPGPPSIVIASLARSFAPASISTTSTLEPLRSPTVSESAPLPSAMSSSWIPLAVIVPPATGPAVSVICTSAPAGFVTETVSAVAVSVITSLSVPPPPWIVGNDAFDVMLTVIVSLPAPPLIWSLGPRETIRSSPAPPFRTSLAPKPPVIESLPPPPLIVTPLSLLLSTM